MNCPSQYPRGFTLLELLAALTIVGVIAGIATPAYRSARDAGLAAEVESRLVSSISDSTRQAVVVGKPVVMCPSTDGATCSNAVEWHTGWVVFTDSNGNRSRDATETIHQRSNEIHDGLGLVTSTGRRLVRFQPSGAAEGTNLTFTLCDSRGKERAIAWVMGNSGRLRRSQPPTDAANRCVASLTRR